MRSATSYFNGTLYRKTLARFWPLWGLWGVGWLFLCPLRLLNSYLTDYHFRATSAQESLLWDARSLPELLASGVFLAACFAILCAMAVFGYLYNSRSACWTHALPMRREALFTTQYLAGLSMMLLPLLATGVLTAIVEVSFLPMESWGEVLSALLTWLLAQCGVCLFFFSFAAFCAMFAGHILALPAFYGILNGLAAGLWFLVDALMNEFYYGYAGMPGALTVVEYLTPAEILTRAVCWFSDTPAEPAHLSSPGTVAAYAAVGVALALFSLYVYRRRHVETAGDVVAVAVVRPLFKYGVSFCAGLAFGMFTAIFFGWSDLPILIPCILVWTVVGYFAAEMLLKKSFRVLKAWKGGAVMTAVMLVLCLLCLMDVFGVVNRVPAAAQVRSVRVEIDMGYPYDGGRTLSADLTDPAQIEEILSLHQAIVDHQDDEGRGANSESDYTSAYFTYTLSSGGVLDRRYRSVPIYAEGLNTKGTVAYALRQIVEDRTLVAMAYDFDGFLKDARLTSAYLNRVYLNGESYSEDLYLDDYRQELWEAVQKDFAEGNIGVRYLFDNDRVRRENTYTTDLIFEATVNYSEVKGPASDDEVYYETRPSNNYLHVTLSPQARNTLAVLEKAGIFEEGYSLIPWDTDYDPRYPDTAAGGGWEIVY